MPDDVTEVLGFSGPEDAYAARPHGAFTTKPRLADLPLLEPKSRAAWRAWLEANHASSHGIWLAVGKKGNAATSLTYDHAVEEALCFGWIDSTVNRLDADRFKQLFTPRKPSSTWARSNKERVERLEVAGLLTDAGRAAIDAAKADGSWSLLDEVEALTIPEDLADALAADPAALCGFGELPNSVKKQALYWIQTAKRPETRTRRIAEVVRTAAEGRGPSGRLGGPALEADG